MNEKFAMCGQFLKNTTLCDPMDYSVPGSSVHGILQARIVEWAAMPSSRDLPDPGIKPRSPALWADSLPSEPPGKTHQWNNLMCFSHFSTIRLNQNLKN